MSDHAVDNEDGTDTEESMRRNFLDSMAAESHSLQSDESIISANSDPCERVSCVLIQSPRNDGRLFLLPVHCRRKPSSLCTTVARTTTPTVRRKNAAVPRPTRRGQYMRQHISRPFSALHAIATMPVRATRFGVRGALTPASQVVFSAP